VIPLPFEHILAVLLEQSATVTGSPDTLPSVLAFMPLALPLLPTLSILPILWSVEFTTKADGSGCWLQIECHTDQEAPFSYRLVSQVPAPPATSLV
jgi:hypothetical protein